MKNKWYLSALLVLLAILGISLDDSAIPNQEIVIRFTDAAVSPDDSQEAIALVKNQLEAIDVDNIQIQVAGNGVLKITYYSDVEVAEIKRLFSNKLEVVLEQLSSITTRKNSQFPSEKDAKRYQLDIYKIQDVDNLVDASGIVLDTKSEPTRFHTAHAYVSSSKLESEEKNRTENVAYSVYRNVAIAIDNTSYKIPEVRAGPFFGGLLG